MSAMQEISGIKHPAFRDAAALTKEGARTESGCYLAEGEDLVLQALRASSDIVSVFALSAAAVSIKPLCAARSVPLYTIGTGLMTKLIGTGYETAVTAVAVVRQRLLSEAELLALPDALILAGERIQDPRNVGVLVRTAEAAGCAALLLSADSAEPFTRAAVRSTTGSILRLPICITPDLPALLSRLREHDTAIIATSARASTLAYAAPLARRPIVLLVGNETEGLSAAARSASTDFVALPMAADGASSLNVTVAAGILLYEAIRQRLEKPLPSL